MARAPVLRKRRSERLPLRGSVRRSRDKRAPTWARGKLLEFFLGGQAPRLRFLAGGFR